MDIKKIFWKLYRKIHKLPKFIKIDASTICQLDCRDCYMRGHLKHTKDPIVGLGVLSFKKMFQGFWKVDFESVCEVGFLKLGKCFLCKLTST